MSTRTGRAAPMAPDERRRAIVDAVVPLLVAHGAAVTTRQIAEAAGVAEGTIFRVFPDKCALMHAAAHATLDPSSGRRALEEVDRGLDLHGTVRALAEHLLKRMEQVMAVMIAVRESTGPVGERGPGPAGPPAFLVEANQALLAGLTEVFERHRDRLAVEPERAALVLRSLVFGSRHPGMQVASSLGAEEIATVLLGGIARDAATPDRAAGPEGGER